MHASLAQSSIKFYVDLVRRQANSESVEGFISPQAMGGGGRVIFSASKPICVIHNLICFCNLTIGQALNFAMPVGSTYTGHQHIDLVPFSQQASQHLKMLFFH